MSVGVASRILGEADSSPDRLLGSADPTLYAAKRLGRNRVICAERMLAEFAGLGRRRHAGERTGSWRPQRPQIG